MTRLSFLSALASAALAGLGGATYTLSEDLGGANFFNQFDFYSGPDPTSGFVQFQTLAKASAAQLVGFSNQQRSVYLGVDYANKAPQGRASVRVESNRTFSRGLLVADLWHMPASTCGSWPAMWMFNDPWPAKGEIDIIEGVNTYAQNSVSLHTTAGCAVANASAPAAGATAAANGSKNSSTAAAFSGLMTTSDCNVKAAHQDQNVGCSIKAPATSGASPHARRDVAFPSYGTGFNQAGGGVYAMEWTSAAISVWFFARNATGTPADLARAIGRPSATTTTTNASSAANATTALDPAAWGTPMARFAGAGCDLDAHFADLRLVFDTTFCGQWADRQWDADSCAAKTGAASCTDYVANNPQAFAEAYWEIASLKWFEQAAGATPKNASVARRWGA